RSHLARRHQPRRCGFVVVRTTTMWHRRGSSGPQRVACVAQVDGVTCHLLEEGSVSKDRPTGPRSSVRHEERPSSLAATSVRSAPTTSGGSNGAPYPPDLRLTQPVISPARLAPWQSPSCAATSASHCGGTSSTSAAYRYTICDGFQRNTSPTEITRSTSEPSPVRLRNEEVRYADPLVRQATRTPFSVSVVIAGSASGKAGSSLNPAMTCATCSSLTV